METIMDIFVEIKNVYGVQTVYPVCDQAKFFAALAGTKTLTAQAIKLIRQQGYSLKPVVPAFA
jgi:hypothetical protein